MDARIMDAAVINALRIMVADVITCKQASPGRHMHACAPVDAMSESATA